MKTVIEMATDAGAIPIHKDYKQKALVGNEAIERFAALVRADEREAISDEWSMCVQSDLEHGVKSLNEQAAKEWFKNYREISKFGTWLEARSNT